MPRRSSTTPRRRGSPKRSSAMPRCSRNFSERVSRGVAVLRLGVEVHLSVAVQCLGVAETSRKGSRVHLG